MLLRIILWSMLIGSIVMGYLGIQSGSATNAAMGIGVLLFVGFIIYFLAKIFFRVGLLAAKWIFIIILIIAFIFLCIRGSQLLFSKEKETLQDVIEEEAVIDTGIKEESIFEKIISFFNDDNTQLITKDNTNNTKNNIINAYALPKTISGKVIDVKSGYLFKIDNHFIKLYGIDAPDPIQKCRDKRNQIYNCGHESKQRLARLILNKTVQCQIAGGDYNENYIATCTIQDVDVGVAMVSLGWAVADRMASKVYIPYEDEARHKQLGLWSGKFIAPWKSRSKKINKINQQKTNEKGLFDGWF